MVASGGGTQPSPIYEHHTNHPDLQLHKKFVAEQRYLQSNLTLNRNHGKIQLRKSLYLFEDSGLTSITSLSLLALITSLSLHHKIDDIQEIIARFWWGSNEKVRSIHQMDQKKMCVSKKDSGLGFCDLRAFNQALLSKQYWSCFIVQNYCCQGCSRLYIYLEGSHEK